ncbi:MAG: 2TM domain-containing protein [Gaiellaceae bacterium]
MPTETLTTNGRIAPTLVEVSKLVPGRADALRTLAARHVEHVRKFKRYLGIYLLSMLVLTPVWIITQYQSADGWPEHLSSRSRYAGDWDPWIIWVALVGAVLVAISGFRAYASRKNSEADIEREVERLTSVS